MTRIEFAGVLAHATVLALPAGAILSTALMRWAGLPYPTLRIVWIDPVAQSPSVVGELPTPVESSAAEGIHGNDGVQ